MASEWGHDIADFAEDLWDEKLEPFGHKVADKSEDAFNTTKDWIKDIWDKVVKKFSSEDQSNMNLSQSSATGYTMAAVYGLTVTATALAF